MAKIHPQCNHLHKYLEYIKSIGFDISDNELRIIWNSRKSLLFSNGLTLIKRSSGMFDVTMRSYNGAEICDMVGLYILHKLAARFGKKTSACTEMMVSPPQ